MPVNEGRAASASDPDGRELFDKEGNRHGGTGEHVVWVRPIVEGGRILPVSILEVWGRNLVNSSGYRWEHYRTLRAKYEGDRDRDKQDSRPEQDW